MREVTIVTDGSCIVSVKAGAFGGCNLASSEVAGLC